MLQSGKQIKPEQLLIWSLIGGDRGGYSGPLLSAIHRRWRARPRGGLDPLALHLAGPQDRLEKLRSQLPDAFDLMSRVLRAGQTISQALESVADEMPRPSGGRIQLHLRAAKSRPVARSRHARSGAAHRATWS